MSVRTSTVVSAGLVVLAVVGILTIFGDTLAALITPPPATEPGAAHATASSPAAAAPTPPPSTHGPGADGGTPGSAADGSS